MADPFVLALVAGAGFIGGAMNALAGGGTFATLPALLAFGLPANVANATSNVALLPGAATSAWTFRDELGPVGGLPWKLVAAAGLDIARYRRHRDRLLLACLRLKALAVE